MNGAPLYPQAYQRWQIALAGEPVAQSYIHQDTQSKLYMWLDKFSRGNSDQVHVVETFAGGPHATARREQQDPMPRLPAGPTYTANVSWWYDGDDQIMPWPADDDAMLLTVYEPERVAKKPSPWNKFLEGTADVGKFIEGAILVWLLVELTKGRK